MFTSQPNTALSLACLALLNSSAFAGLIVNGDFESGNTGFTTDYSYVAAGFNTTEGEYTVRSNPNSFNGSFYPTPDHTSGTGLMMIINGATTGGLTVWGQSVSVQSNSNYDLSLWVSTAVLGGPAVLDVSVNGTLIGTVTADDELGTWKQFTAPWNSGLSTTADIEIVNSNLSTFPNDFYIDDIDFTARTVTDAVPEPASLALWTLLALGCTLATKRRRTTITPGLRLPGHKH